MACPAAPPRHQGPRREDLSAERVSQAGAARLIIVPTVRTTQDKGEALVLRALLLAKEACNAVTVTYKPLGSAAQVAQTVKLDKIAREVYQGAIPAQKTSFEYSIAAECGAEKLTFPSGAPTIMQSVVVM